MCRRERQGRARSVAALACAVAAVGIVAGCGDGGGSSGVSAQDIVADPQSFYGETVTVETTVSRPIDHRVWEMADGKLFMIKDDAANPAPREGERMRITGTVHPLERATIQGKLGIPIEQHFYSDRFLDDDVAVVVHSLERLGG